MCVGFMFVCSLNGVLFISLRSNTGHWATEDFELDSGVCLPWVGLERGLGLVWRSVTGSMILVGVSGGVALGLLCPVLSTSLLPDLFCLHAHSHPLSLSFVSFLLFALLACLLQIFFFSWKDNHGHFWRSVARVGRYQCFPLNCLGSVNTLIKKYQFYIYGSLFCKARQAVVMRSFWLVNSVPGVSSLRFGLSTGKRWRGSVCWY
ncbi:hypothetical protein V8F20_000082 [Naviculisporaceae sp. PSN 640]